MSTKFLLLTIFATTFALRLKPDPDDYKISAVVTKIMTEWSRRTQTTETLVACFINFQHESTVFELIVKDVLRKAHTSGRYQMVLSRDPFSSSVRPSDFRCSVTVLGIDDRDQNLRFLEVEGKLKRWNRFGLFVVIYAMQARDREMVLMDWTFGLGKVFFVKCVLQGGEVSVRYPLIYYNKAIAVEQSAISYWIDHDQQNNFNGNLYAVIASYNIPYWYKRSSTYTAGIDFRFLTNMIHHQNASYVAGRNTESVDGKMTLLKLQRSITSTREGLIYLNEQDIQCILMAKYRIKNYFIHLLRPFLTAVWIVIVCLGVILFIIRKLWPGFFTKNYILSVFFGMAIEEHQLAPVDRSIIFNIGLLVFLLGEAYLAVMTTFMFNMKYEPELTSFEQFASKDIPLYVPPDHYMLLKKTSHNLNIMLFDQETPNEADEESVKKLYDPSRAYLVPCSHARWTVGRSYMKSQLDYQYYVIADSIYFRLQTFSVAPNSLSTEKIADYVQRFTEGGFWQHWEVIETEYLHRHEELESSDMLSFQALISLFWILCFGHALALASFALEVVCNFASVKIQ